MVQSNCVPSLSKSGFVDSCRDGSGGIPPLSAEIPYFPPEFIYPLFSGKDSFLFESVKGPEKIARYSFIGFEPYLTFIVKDRIIKVKSPGGEELFSEKPLRKLAEILWNYPQKPSDELPPFQGGAAGLLSYDFVHYFERLPKRAIDDLSIPEAQFYIIDRLIAFDHLEKKSWVIVCPGVRGYTADDMASVYDETVAVLERICSRVASPRGDASGTSGHRLSKSEIIHRTSRGEYTDMVRRAKEYIAAGDIFQANLSQRIAAHIGDATPWSLYTVLRTINPSPFAGIIDFGDYALVSSSPERLVRVRGRAVDTRPIAGTRPRGRDSYEDEKMRADLLLNEKERAEHIMLIDLERNDIGKVAEYGSVTVDELMITEDYSHVIHIVSNVAGKLAQGKSCLDVLRAVFPGGTITGVPKVRCMEIIDELEPVRRGPYTGSFGYVGYSGNMDMNIIIRTFVIKDGFAYVQAGAGIVADSDPEREYHEALKKAEALMRTLEQLS